MKKQYMKPATAWAMMDEEVVLAGSVPTADGQTDPTLDRDTDDDLWGPEAQLLGDNPLYRALMP